MLRYIYYNNLRIGEIHMRNSTASAEKLQPEIQRRARTQVQGDNPFYKPDLGRQNGNQLTTKQLALMFDVTAMSIYNWRLNRNLPYFHLQGGVKPPVRYDEGLVIHWSEVHNVTIYNENY